MKFIDEVEIEIEAGAGANGCIHFRREKFVSEGGPDGGDGGNGGDIFFMADEGVNTLINFRGKKHYKADDGGKGAKQRRFGKTGEKLVIKVPPGTLLFDKESGNLIHDISVHGEEILVARGGRGGLGNPNYKTPTNQCPSYAQEGKPGEAFELKLELKLLADIALIGLPNAGKSTLISVISDARPKVADYPFTTLEPNLGVVKMGEQSLCVADIPGLIEDAADGKGLGHKFLKHIERTSAYVHLIDCSMFLEAYEAVESYMIVKAELLKYKEEISYKKEIVCMTKIDAMTEEEIEKFRSELEKHLDKKVLAISSVSGRNIEEIKRLMMTTKFN
jgi:GTP-binding protein